MLEKMQFGWVIFTLSHVAYITVDFKKLVNRTKRPISPWFHFGKKGMYQEKNDATEIAPKHNNSLKPFHMR